MAGRWQTGPKSENKGVENYRQLQSSSFYQLEYQQGILLPVYEDAKGGVKWHSHRSDQADTV